MDSAIDSRTSVGVIGLATAAWAGLGWMANLREALSQMWGQQRDEPAGLRARPSCRICWRCCRRSWRSSLTIALTALGDGSVMAAC